MSLGAGNGAAAEMILRGGPSTESQKYGLPGENDRVRVSLGMGNSAHSQKLYFKWATVCKAKCIGFRKKMGGFKCVRVRGTVRIRRNDNYRGPKYGEENVWVSLRK